MSTAEVAAGGADGPLSIFPTDAPWRPEAGFVVERPPAQLDGALARAVAKTRSQEGDRS